MADQGGTGEPLIERAARRVGEAAQHDAERAAQIAKMEVRRALHRHPRDLYADHGFASQVGAEEQLEAPVLTRADRIAQRVVGFMGSVRYFYWQTIIVVLWIGFNLVGIFGFRWDVYPFILLNLCFSTQAAYAAPLILLAQNKESQVNRHVDLNAYEHMEDTRADVKELREHADGLERRLETLEQMGLDQHRQILTLLSWMIARSGGDADRIASAHDASGREPASPSEPSSS